MQAKYSFLLFWVMLFFVAHHFVFGDRAENSSFPMMNDAIKTDNSIPVDSLVRGIFAEKLCTNISNIQSIGSLEGIGYFKDASTSIGIQEGIILATGDVANAQPPNNATDFSGDFDDGNGDIDLSTISANSIYDAVGIEFDFEPLDSFVSFRYVFASEEYCEFVGSIYNDVFGFFISGPGISGPFLNGAINVALIPGTEDFVAINSVNQIINSQYYIGNELQEDADQCEIGFSSTPYLNQTQYDGFTRQLNAILKLTPCETYHIKLVVADVGDNFYDSAVFLEAGSFNIGGAVKVKGVVQNSDDGLLHEGCPNGFFEFKRQNLATIDFPLNVNYNISAASTATSALDYLPLSGNVILPAGSNVLKVPVEAILDGIDEPVESIILELDVPCFCSTDSAVINIADPLDFTFNLPNVTLCESSTGIAMPEIEGGVPPFSYQWSNNLTDESIILTADDPSNFSLTITDACGNVAEDAAQILITNSPSAQLSNSATICEGDTAYLEVQFTGLAPWQIEYSINGNSPILVEAIMESPYFLAVTEEGTYTLAGMADLACDGDFSGSGEVIVNRIEADIQVTPVICYGDSNGSIEIEITEGIPPFEYNWSNGTSGTNVIEGLASAWYELSIVDARNCTKVLEIEVPSPTPIERPSVNCDDLLNGRLSIEASGGTPPFLYSVNDGPFETENIFQNLEPAETYDLVVEDANGCQASFPFIMPMAYSQAASLPSVIPISVGQEVILQPELEIPAELIANVRWIPEGVLSCNDCLNPNFRATEDIELTLRIFDIFGCSSQITVQIVVDFKADIFVPTVFSPNGDEANDYFTIFTNPFQTNQINSLQIFDRWGALIFETKNIPSNEPEQGWDGRFKGQMMNSGVYVYIAVLEFPDGSEQQVKGSLTLLR